jgi:hypothetical protein
VQIIVKLLSYIPQEMADEVKCDARGDRLSIKGLRKANEEVLRKQLLLEANQKCKEEFHNFGACAQKNNLWVVFLCRQVRILEQDSLITTI